MSNDGHGIETDAALGKCLYCGYDLSGLPDDTRCPECGRQSIPAAFRREVQEIFDSPIRLYREALRVIGKHPPGWFWSLDRPRDVARSFRIAIVNVLLCVIITGGACLMANAYVLRETRDTFYVDPSGVHPPLHAFHEVTHYGAFGLPVKYESEDYAAATKDMPADRMITRRSQFSRDVYFQGLCFGEWEFCVFISIILVMIWVMVTQLGMWTQIRRGLPAFARARRTIMAAGNCESCKLPFQAMLVAVCLAAETAIRLGLPDSQLRAQRVFTGVLVPFMVILLYTSWVGPLRSDFTRQLIRSRVHAVRMYVMYVVLFPWPLSGIIIATIYALVGERY